ncbi:Hypothetical predicted protein, partial [Paramuricea clavata]
DQQNITSPGAKEREIRRSSSDLTDDGNVELTSLFLKRNYLSKAMNCLRSSEGTDKMIEFCPGMSTHKLNSTCQLESMT